MQLRSSKITMVQTSNIVSTAFWKKGIGLTCQKRVRFLHEWIFRQIALNTLSCDITHKRVVQKKDGSVIIMSSSLGYRSSRPPVRPDGRNRPSEVSGMTATTNFFTPYSILSWLNVGMASVHTALAVSTLVVTKNLNLQAPVFRVTFELNYTMDHESNIQSITQEVNNGTISDLNDVFNASLEPLRFGLPIAWLTFWFFALTALAHAGAGIVYTRAYFFLIENKCNPLRWLEYSITASLMWLILAQAFAFIDINSLFLSTAMIFVTMASGVQCEYISRPSLDKDAWTLPLGTRLAFLIPGVVLYTSAATMLCVSMVTGVDGTLPDFVVPTVVTQLIFFGSFAFVLIWQQCNPPSKWVYGEYMFQGLSLLSKAVLGIVLLLNILIYEEYACVFDDSSC